MAPKINKKWSESDIQNALKDVNEGVLSIRAAAKKHGMRESTIRLRLKNIRSGKEIVGSGRKPALSAETEAELAGVIRSLCTLGFSPTRAQVKDLVSEYVIEKKIATPFKEGRPGRDWLNLFMERNKLTLKKATMISSARKSVTANPFVVYDFYDVLEKTIAEKGFTAETIWNCDESGFPSDPKRCKVISGSGEIAYRVTPGAGRENTTTLAAVNAAGRALPPLVIFSGKNHQESWHSENSMPGTLYGVSDNGWMTSDVFEEWFNHFCREVKERPLLLLFDGHLSHVTARLILKAMKEDVTIIKFPPHVTDLLQPLDVSCFGPLKRDWEKVLNDWCSTFGGKRALRKSDFVEKLGECWGRALTADNIIAGFRKTGIFPPDRTKYPSNRFDPRLLKRYDLWCKVGKPEEMMDQLSMAVSTPKKLQINDPKTAVDCTASASTSNTDHSIEPSTAGPSSKVRTPRATHCSMPTPSFGSNDLTCYCHQLGPKPLPYPGKVWTAKWVLDDPPSFFEDRVLDKVKGPLDDQAPIKKRRKVDRKTKIITNEEYLEAISEPVKPAKKAKKKIDFKKKSKENETNEEEIDSETEEEIIEGESEEEEVEEDEEEKLIKFWKSIAPPTKEDEIIGKWFAFIYETKRSSHMYVGKVTERFLKDKDGPVQSLMVDSLKPRIGTSTVLESYVGDSRDISLVKAEDIIAGPIKIIPLKGNKWDIPEYEKLINFFNNVKKINRSVIYNIECAE